MRQAFREAPWYRSMLFVPGHKLDWMLKAPKYGADAYVFDLEDAVTIEQKPQARESVGKAIDELKGEDFGRFVRINPWRTGNTMKDVLAVTRPGLDGLLLPKTEDVEDVMALDLVLTDLEIEEGLPEGRIEIWPLLETARAMYRCYDLCMASQRVRRASGASGTLSGGDGARALGIRPTSDDGHEGLIVNGRTGTEARAAGITRIMGGMTNKVEDLDFVRRRATLAKSLGATGSLAIHPSHIAILNEVFSPSEGEIREAREILAVMSGAIKRGDAAVRYGDKMVDYAHVRSSMKLLGEARSFGIDVGELPDIQVLSLGLE